MDAITSGSDDTESGLPQSDTPVNLRPDLTVYGIAEVDRGICMDTVENRQILRSQKLAWIAMYDHRGRPTNTIEVRSAEMIEQRGIEILEGKKILLTDPRNRNSDFVTGLDLLFEPKAESLVPAWILHATRTYLALEEERAANPGKIIKPQYNGPPSRCTIIKSDGVRCQLWSAGRTKDKGLCRTHVGSVLNTATGSIEQARRRISQVAPYAVDVMEEMLHATSEPVRLKAASELLDRAGVRGGIEIDTNVNVDVKPAAVEILERLERLRQGAEKTKEIAARALHPDEPEDPENTVDAEIVED